MTSSGDPRFTTRKGIAFSPFSAGCFNILNGPFYCALDALQLSMLGKSSNRDNIPGSLCAAFHLLLIKKKKKSALNIKL